MLSIVRYLAPCRQRMLEFCLLSEYAEVQRDTRCIGILRPICFVTPDWLLFW